MVTAIKRGKQTTEPVAKILKIIENFLTESGTPQTVESIYQRIKEKEATNGGKINKHDVSNILGRKKQFKYTKGEGWRLVS